MARVACRSVGCVVWLVALVLTAVWPVVARAEEKARLVYVRGAGADDCPEEVDLRLWVMARLGYDPFSPQASRVVLARVEAREQRLEGTVEVVDQEGKSQGRRELSSQSQKCQELARALALSISLAIDPERAVSHDSTPAKAPEPTPPPPAPEPVAPPVAPAASPRPTWFTSLALAGSIGTLPATAFGGVGAVGLRGKSLSLALEGRALQSLSRELSPRGTLSGALLGGGLAACWSGDILGLCATGQIGGQRLGSADVARPSSSTGLYVGLGPRVGARLPLGRSFALALGLEGLFALFRNTAQLSGAVVWKTPAAAGTLLLGIESHFL